MPRTIELTDSQIWIITKALVVLTSEEQARKLWVEFPQLDFDALSDDLDEILDKLGAECEDCQEVAQ